MMVERHYDDESLIALMEADRAGSDGHVPACPACREKVASFRMLSGALHHHDVWDTREVPQEPSASTIATLRAFADRMAFDDANAEGIVAELLAGPREEWMPRLREHPEWRTAGVVRKLVEASGRAIDTMPPDALEITALSTEIAGGLEAAAHRTGTVERLRGAAWRDRAYALYYVGRFAESLAAADAADAHFGSCMVDEYDRARVAVVRTLALRAKEDVGGATEAIRFSGEIFTRFDDATRLVAARIAEMHILFSRGQFQAAFEVLEPLERRLRVSSDAADHARVLSNMGSCLFKLGRVEDALRHHESAALLFEMAGIPTESARSRWNIAAVLAGAGRVDEACVRFEALETTFESLGMASEATLVSLERAELLIAGERFEEVAAICGAAMRYFERAGIPYSARALTALAYIKEAAEHRKVTLTLVKHVHDYIRRLPQNREMLFVPPPPGPDLPRVG